jgi:hypothetical protein
MGALSLKYFTIIFRKNYNMQQYILSNNFLHVKHLQTTSQLIEAIRNVIRRSPFYLIYCSHNEYGGSITNHHLSLKKEGN